MKTIKHIETMTTTQQIENIENAEQVEREYNRMALFHFGVAFEKLPMHQRTYVHQYVQAERDQTESGLLTHNGHTFDADEIASSIWDNATACETDLPLADHLDLNMEIIDTIEHFTFGSNFTFDHDKHTAFFNLVVAQINEWEQSQP